MMGKKLVTGDRNWTDTDAIAEEMATWSEDTVLIHGDAKGADTIARQCAELLGMKHVPYPYMRELGKAGGPVRNIKMLNENPDIEEVVAFHNDIERSKGTKHMIGIAKKSGVPVRLITSKIKNEN